MSNPLLIAGPCAAESEEQLMTTAGMLSKQLKAHQFELAYFRAGVWKPRSKPTEFKGAGKKAIAWLKQIEQLYGFTPCVEVAKPEHIDLCEKQGVTTFWIGARTSVNPFLTEELAEAAKGRDLTIMVKNPMVPDLKLWIGAIERFQKAAVKQVLAIHRGVADANENIFRNAPCWEMPIELKMQFPDMPLICDASHIAGNKRYLQTLSQIALDFSFDGLMLETHYNPAVALSDIQQQITPEELIHLLKSLVFKEQLNSPVEDALRKQRHLIEHIDTQINRLFQERMKVVDAIAEIKATNKLPIVDPKQFKKVKERYMKEALQDEDYITFLSQYLDLLHQTSIQRQLKHE